VTAVKEEKIGGGVGEGGREGTRKRHLPISIQIRSFKTRLGREGSGWSRIDGLT
jgi:hypothetical protein